MMSVCVFNAEKGGFKAIIGIKNIGLDVMSSPMLYWVS